jgi:alpha-tubulin suppressor-like RCC1 family protein
MTRGLTPGSTRLPRGFCWAASAGLAALLTSSLPAASAATTAASQAGSTTAQSRAAVGAAYSWGNNATGELGQGNHTNALVPKRVLRLPANSVKAVSAGTNASLALTRSGTVQAWGDNSQGQLGTGNQRESTSPVAVKDPGGRGQLTGITAIVSANVASAALDRNGNVLAWGSNIWGQVGNGQLTGPQNCPVNNTPAGPSNVCSKLPVTVVGPSGTGKLSRVVAIAGSSDDDLALRSDGTVWTWGINVAGELGIGTNTGPEECKPYKTYAAVGCSSKPVEVKGPGGTGVLDHVVAVTGGSDFDLALRSDGTVWAWGSDAFATLGQTAPPPERCYDPFDFDAIPCSTTPVQVSAPGGVGHLTHIVAISAEPSPNGLHVLALRSDGTVWAWGVDDKGQLGNGASEQYDNLPGEVVGPDGKGHLQHVVAIAAGGGFSLAKLANGSIWAWGQNNQGQLGIGTSKGPSLCTTDKVACSLVPVQVKGPYGAGHFERALQIAAGQVHALAVELAADRRF